MTATTTKMRVLVVDDEPIMAETLVLILEKAGMNARAAYSGGEALEAFVDFAPDALITDVKMGGMSGVELAVEIRNRSPGCRILLYSGRASDSDLKPAEAAGYHFAFVSKPVHPQVLLDWLACSQTAETA